MAKVCGNDGTNDKYYDSNIILHGNKKLSTLLNENYHIVDVTQSQSGRNLHSKINFDDPRVLFFILYSSSSWSDTGVQMTFINAQNTKYSVVSSWVQENSVWFYCTIMETINKKQIRVYKFAQGNDILNNNYTLASDSNSGAIVPRRLYAVMKGVN